MKPTEKKSKPMKTIANPPTLQQMPFKKKPKMGKKDPAAFQGRY